MRELTSDEREIVAGGWNSLYYLDDVFINNRRYYLEDMSWFEAYLGGSSGEGGGGGGGEDSPEKPPEEKPKQEHKIDPCKLGVPVDHLVPPKGWVASKLIGASDIREAWGKALGNFSNADLQAIKSGLEVIRDGLPSWGWTDLFNPDPLTAASAGYAIKISETIKFIDQALKHPPEQRYQFATAIGYFFFEWSESKYFSFLPVKNKFKGSCGA